MAGDLFVKAKQQETLEAFVQRVTTMFHVAEVERRESSNYVGGEYFAGTALSLKITFAPADEVDLDGYDFWIHLRPTGAWVETGSFVDGLADLLARRLTIAGDSVVRLPSAERKEGPKVFYALDPQAPHGSKEQVVTKEG